MAIKVGEKDLFPYLGDYGPVSIYKGKQKLAGYKWAEKSGRELYFDNTYNSHVHIEVDGQSYQHAEPTPDSPIEIHSLNDFDVVSSTEKLTEGQLQEYDYGVEYENVDKINLNLSEPLRSVGNFKDRLFKDSDGLWKVERSVGYILLNGNQTLTVEHVLENTCRVRYQPEVQLIHIPMSDGLVKTSRFKTVHNSGNWRQDRELVEQDHSMVSIRINKGRLNGVTSSDVNNWFRSNHTEVLYTPSTPTIETLDQELQDKLNTLKSFKDSNYVYTVLPNDDLTPTIHAKTEVKDI